MKVFGKFKCIFCDGSGYEERRKTDICSSCNGTGYSTYRQEYRDGDLLLETCLCNKKGPGRKKYKWCVEVCTLQRCTRRDIIHHMEKDKIMYVWAHDWDLDAWSGSLKSAYKQAIKNGKLALKRRTKYTVHAMIMDLLDDGPTQD